MKSPRVPSRLRFPRMFTINSVNKPIHRRRSRRLICLVLLLNLLIWPSPGLARQLGNLAADAVRSSSITITTGSVRIASYLLKALFRSQTARRKDTLADRLAQVARVEIWAHRFVAYQGQAQNFSALPTNLSGQTLQGVRFDGRHPIRNRFR